MKFDSAAKWPCASPCLLDTVRHGYACRFQIHPHRLAILMIAQIGLKRRALIEVVILYVEREQ
jgi:hypothetical protein